MAWIESHDDLAGHPKTRRAARMLGISVPTMMGHLHLLWHWCLRHAESGDLTDYDPEDIADAVMWDGDANDLVESLLNCGPGDKKGFLERSDGGRLLVHDWMDYAGQLILSRQEMAEAGARGNHERWHVQRGITDPNCPYCHTESHVDQEAIGTLSGGESGGESGGDHDPNRVLSHRTPQYLTPHNQTNGFKNTVSLGSDECVSAGSDDIRPQEKEIYPEAFERFWSEYPRKVEKRGALQAWNTTLKGRKGRNRASPLPTADVLIICAQNYARQCDADKTQPKYIKHPSTFLGPSEPWRDYEKPVVSTSRRLSATERLLAELEGGDAS